MVQGSDILDQITLKWQVRDPKWRRRKGFCDMTHRIGDIYRTATMFIKHFLCKRDDTLHMWAASVNSSTYINDCIITRLDIMSSANAKLYLNNYECKHLAYGNVGTTKSLFISYLLWTKILPEYRTRSIQETKDIPVPLTYMTRHGIQHCYFF